MGEIMKHFRRYFRVARAFFLGCDGSPIWVDLVLLTLWLNFWLIPTHDTKLLFLDYNNWNLFDREAQQEVGKAWQNGRVRTGWRELTVVGLDPLSRGEKGWCKKVNLPVNGISINEVCKWNLKPRDADRVSGNGVRGWSLWWRSLGGVLVFCES